MAQPTPEERARLAAIRKHENAHKRRRHGTHHGRSTKATGSLLARAFDFMLVPGMSPYPLNDIRRIPEYLGINGHTDQVVVRAARTGSLVSSAVAIYQGVEYELTYSPVSMSYSAKAVPSA